MPNLLRAKLAWLLGIELEGLQRLVPSPDRGLCDPGTSAMNRNSRRHYECRSADCACLDARTANSIYKDPEPQGGWQRSTGRNTKQPRGADHTSRPRDTEACDSSSQLTRHQTDGHLTRPIAPRRAQVRIAAAEEWQRKAAMCEQSGIRAWIRGLPPR